MSDPAISDPHADQARRVALIAILAGAAIMLLKLGVYGMTHSAAVLSDALESVVNILAAGMMYFAVWLAGQPADRDHPYGHGKVEFMALGFEGGTILAAGCGIGATAIWRLIHPVDLERLDTGTWLIGAVTLLTVILAAYVYRRGKRYAHPVLIADAKHLGTDVLTTVGVFIGLILVQATHRPWLDPVVALGMTVFIFITSWRMLRVSIQGLMDYSDPADQAAIAAILDDEVRSGAIRSYHKVRLRHTGRFHWVDMHLQVDPNLIVRDSHALGSRIEYRIEQRLSPGKATAHIEPADTPSPAAQARAQEGARRLNPVPLVTTRVLTPPHGGLIHRGVPAEGGEWNADRPQSPWASDRARFALYCPILLALPGLLQV